MFHLSNTNQKGQLVLPHAMRKQLGIVPETTLALSVQGNTLVITPVLHVTTANEESLSFQDILEQTQGAWAESAKKSEHMEVSSQRKRELKATKEAQTASW